jgi:hypothetical protein
MEAHLDVKSPHLPRAHEEFGLVRRDNGLDDGEAETETLTVPYNPVRGHALERLEETSDLLSAFI